LLLDNLYAYTFAYVRHRLNKSLLLYNLCWKYPHIVYGAVASSAPVRAITNFKGYNEVVAQSIANDTFGGNLEVNKYLVHTGKNEMKLIHQRRGHAS